MLLLKAIVLGQMMRFVVVQSLSCVRLFVTPWTAACRAPLSFSFPDFAQIHIH